MPDGEPFQNPYQSPGGLVPHEATGKRSFLLWNLQLAVLVYGMTIAATVFGASVGVVSTVVLYGVGLACLLFGVSFSAARKHGLLPALLRLQFSVLSTIFAAIGGSYPAGLSALRKLNSSSETAVVMIFCAWVCFTSASIAGAMVGVRWRKDDS